MKIIDAKGAILGRLASYVAKEALKGEEFVILNCKEIIITGNRKNIEENFKAKRGRVGTNQTGPKHSRLAHLIVKRTIRGMLPNFREGRGKQILERIKCYPEIPKEFEESKKISLASGFKGKHIEVKEVSK
jgi:large subunit ribosomal protein L13